MEKFLEFLHREDLDYEIQDGAVIVLAEFSPILSADVKLVIPENVTFIGGLDIYCVGGKIQLPETLKVSCILDLKSATVTRLPSNLTIYDYCSVYLDAHKIENVSFRDNCGRFRRTIFAFWANNDFLIAAGCFIGTYSEFATAVDKKYDGNKAVEYKQNARDCISELAEKLGKPDPFKNQ